MEDCTLTNRQRELLLSLIPGIQADTFVRPLVLEVAGGEIRLIAELDRTGELWRNVWKGVKLSDFDYFVDCGYMIISPNGGYSLAEQRILSLDENPKPSISAFDRTEISSFLSYKSLEKHVTERLADLLRRVYGDEAVWFDKRLFGGQQWWDEITRQIERRDAFVYLLSREALESIYCRMEFSEAWRLGKHIIPVEVRKITSKIPEAITRFQIIRRISDQDFSADDIVEIIASIQRSSVDTPDIALKSLWANRTIAPTGENSLKISVRVPADFEPSEREQELCNTGILLAPGDYVSIRVSGTISVDNGQTRQAPTGLYRELNTNKMIIAHSPQAYKVRQSFEGKNPENGTIGSLISWIGNENINGAFLVGDQSHFSVDKQHSGFLYLAVNDTKGMYSDNLDQFDVTIELRNE